MTISTTRTLKTAHAAILACFGLCTTAAQSGCSDSASDGANDRQGAAGQSEDGEDGAAGDGASDGLADAEADAGGSAGITANDDAGTDAGVAGESAAPSGGVSSVQAGQSSSDEAGAQGTAGPTPCETTDDCVVEGACPVGASQGCACSNTPQGNLCVPRCAVDADCPDAPDQALTCSGDGLCRPGDDSAGGGGTFGDGGAPPSQGGSPGSGDGGSNSSSAMTTETTISDQAQSMTIAFDALAFVTGSFCAQTFYPPGKVADFFGFQYLRDNDVSGMGHNTDFTTLTADPMLAILTDEQLTTLADLGDAEAELNDAYGYARFPLAHAFRRLNDGDVPDGHPTLSREAVKAYSAYLFGIDGQMSHLRAQAYASVLGSMNAEQQATLAAMKGYGSLDWQQPAEADVEAVLARYPNRMMRTYAGEMLAWYLGNVDADVYFCPERQGTYFGSFFMKDVKAMHNPSTTIDSNMTADMGDTFLDLLDAAARTQVTDLVAVQKADLLDIVAKREELSTLLRQALAGAAIEPAAVIALAQQYGELDGDISYEYATHFSAVSASLSEDQKATLMALRKTATAEEDGSADYDESCGNGYLYSEPLQSAPTVMNTDFLFGVCADESAVCATNWDCCSFACAEGRCAEPFELTSSAFADGGTLDTEYTCDDAAGGKSPPLAWSGAPDDAAEFALTMTTLALDGTKYNWVLFHVPSDVLSLEAASEVGTAGSSTDGPELRYYPPCSAGPGVKSYVFTLYALSESPTFSVPEDEVDGPTLLDAIAPLTVARAELAVNYARVESSE